MRQVLDANDLLQALERRNQNWRRFMRRRMGGLHLGNKQ